MSDPFNAMLVVVSHSHHLRSSLEEHHVGHSHQDRDHVDRAAQHHMVDVVVDRIVD